MDGDRLSGLLVVPRTDRVAGVCMPEKGVRPGGIEKRPGVTGRDELGVLACDRLCWRWALTR